LWPVVFDEVREVREVVVRPGQWRIAAIRQEAEGSVVVLEQMK
jgi:hypothetical protein